MSQFKRFNASENNNFNTNDAYPQGTLTWDPNNGLRVHDGSTGGGVAVGGDTGYTRFIGSGIGSYDINSGSSYNMIMTPNWDGEFPGQVSITLPSNENFGSPLQLVHNSDGGIQLITKNNATWTFDKDGNLTIPSTSGGMIKTAANASIGIVAMDDGTNNPAQMMSWNVNAGNPTTIVSTYSSNVTIQTDVTGTMKTWSFDNTGNLTLPDNTVISSAPKAEPSFTLVYQTFVAQVGKRYLVDSLGEAAITTMPASPTAGDAIFFMDAYGSFSVNNLVIHTNGANIMGSSSDYVASQNEESFGLAFNGTEWRRY